MIEVGAAALLHTNAMVPKYDNMTLDLSYHVHKIYSFKLSSKSHYVI